MRRLFVAIVLALATGGCSMGALPVPPASIKTVSAIESVQFPPLAIGSFIADPAVRDRDKSFAIRGGIITAETGSFAGYLGETLKRQLAAAGRLDPASSSVVTGRLTVSSVSSAIGANAGKAALGGEFTLTRCGKEAFRKQLEVGQSWDSSFIGAVAIPAAESAYAGLYTTLVEKLLTDPDFIAAAQATACS
jgi:hypothetical protein